MTSTDEHRTGSGSTSRARKDDRSTAAAPPLPPADPTPDARGAVSPLRLKLEHLTELINEVYTPEALARAIDDEVEKQVLAEANHFTLWLHLNGILQGLRNGSMTVVDTPFLANQQRHYAPPEGENPPAPTPMIPREQALEALRMACAELDPHGWGWTECAEERLREAGS